MSTVADRVKILRQELKLTQAALGQRAGGITKQAVWQWERGITEPQWEALNALQRTCGVNPYWLLHGTAPMLQAGDATARTGTFRAAPSDHPEQRPLAELLDDLSRRLAMADPAVRDEVTRLVLRYLENPPAGTRIAKAIELLLGQDETPPDA
ncbi:helix-turn-helix domain-containing protein [Thiorhodococcus minor]|uniref:Helix-turn-helix transcriptional regulator n=1 Tax=Thiorhodococcus minor TaxID=57489 RepID=A0A6M0K2L8_9GAMM|nr:helix-turn-helix transcriptional regulator [Thiorhodococcus minor]NEV63996.1 helix-turn-helix transcriptional regulator [Thiorhodococcus minor]